MSWLEDYCFIGARTILVIYMTEALHQLPADKKRQRLIKVQAHTNPNYGKAPADMTIPDLLSCAMINLDKPSGPSSHQVAAWVKLILEVDSAGHGGTLDPNVTGVLPTAIGRGKRALQVMLFSGKEYVGIMKVHKQLPKKTIVEICTGFIGDIYQVPPLRSAVKRVRRKRRIYYFDILEIKGTDVLFKVGCEAGTYIRTLCVDIGKKLGCGAHLAALRRTRVGTLQEANAVTLHDIKDAYIRYKEEGYAEDLKSMLLPMERLLTDIPKIVVRDSAIDAICHGADLALPGVVEVDSLIKQHDLVAVLSLKGEGVALMSSLMSTEQMIEKDTGICASIERVLMNKGTYPSIWKKT
jgi:H/ACA ribonucleoprotein complex subunit 4